MGTPSACDPRKGLFETPRSAARFAWALRSFMLFAVPFGYVQEWCSEGFEKALSRVASCFSGFGDERDFRVGGFY